MALASIIRRLSSAEPATDLQQSVLILSWPGSNLQPLSSLVLRLWPLRSAGGRGCRHQLDLLAAGGDTGGALRGRIELVRAHQCLARLAVAPQDEQRLAFVQPEDRFDLRVGGR